MFKEATFRCFKISFCLSSNYAVGNYMLWMIIGGCLANGIDGAKFSFLLCFYRTKWDKMWCEGGVAGYAVILYSIQFSMCQDFCSGRYLLNCNYNNNNNNESLFHQKIKLHIIYYSKTYVTTKRRIKNYDKNFYIYIYNYVITINGA